MCTFPLVLLLPPPPMVRANLSPRATFNATRTLACDKDNAIGWIAMIGGDEKNAREDDGDEIAISISTEACRIAGGREGIVMMLLS
jgi:hypothetical protein